MLSKRLNINHVQPLLPVEKEILTSLFNQIKTSVVNEYEENSISSNKTAFESCKNELIQAIEMEHDIVFNRNEKLARQSCDALLQDLFLQHVQPHLEITSPSFYQHMDALIVDWAKVHVAYLENAKGPSACKLEFLCKFTKTKLLECAKTIETHRENLHAAQVSRMEAECSRLKENCAELTGEKAVFEQEMEQMYGRIATLTEEKMRLEGENGLKEENVLKWTLASKTLEEEKTALSDRYDAVVSELTVEKEQHSIVQKEMKELKSEFTTLLQVKERQELEVNMLTEENEELRKGSSHCQCVIS